MENKAYELQKPLGREYVSERQGHAYLEGHAAVKLANDIFGFDGWSSEIRKIKLEYIEEVNGKYNAFVSCIMRVSIREGTFHEDAGSGSSTNMPTKYMAFQNAHKEAATDALKRTLRLFGRSLGNCLHDDDYSAQVLKEKPEKLTFDLEDLRRPQQLKRA